MKKLLSISVLLLLYLTITGFNLGAQQLYNTSGKGLFRFNTADNSVTQLGSFSAANIGGAFGSIIHVGNGVLVGLVGGSPNLYGGIYKTDTSSNSVNLLLEFTNTNRPQSNLVLADNGMLYCLGNVASSNESAIYSFNMETNTYTKEYEITGKAKTGMHGGMVKGPGGILYGITQRGGNEDAGRIFSFNTNNSVYTSLFEFSSANGTNPVASLTLAKNGKLYGVANYGGVNDKGTLFSFDINSNQFHKLFDFVQESGEAAISPLIQASDGKLYGTAMAGGSYYRGVLYSFDISTNTYTDIYNFNYTQGCGPRVHPIEVNGKLYGSVNEGGTNYAGMIYSYDLSSSVLTKLYDGDNETGGITTPFFSFGSYDALGVNRVEADTLSVFPNPAEAFFTINNIPAGSVIRISNLLGGIVYQKNFSNSQETISTNTFSEGIYFVRVENKGFSTVKKIVVK